MQWTNAKRELQKKTERELYQFIKSLYDLNQTNRDFFAASLASDNSKAIKSYKKVISKAVNPSHTSPIDLKRGRKAIADFRKAAPDDIAGQVELMFHFVESGARQTLKYGDLYQGFYDSMGNMLDSIVELSPKLTADDHAKLVEQFDELASRTHNRIGWGISDDIADAAHEIAQQEP